MTGAAEGNAGSLRTHDDRFRPGSSQEAQYRLQRRCKRLSQRQDSLPWQKCPTLPRPRLSGYRESGKRRRLPAAEKRRKRTRACCKRVDGRLGVYLPVRRHGWGAVVKKRMIAICFFVAISAGMVYWI